VLIIIVGLALVVSGSSRDDGGLIALGVAWVLGGLLYLYVAEQRRSFLHRPDRDRWTPRLRWAPATGRR
jgi:hypothetical protein